MNVKNKLKSLLILILVMTMMLSGCNLTNPRSWNLILESAKDTTVNLALIGARPRMMTWFEQNLRNAVKTNYGINLNIIPISLNDYINGSETGDVIIDAVYFGGEGFRQAYEKGLLFGPFAEKLQNFSLLTSNDNYREGISGNNNFVPIGREILFFVYDDILFYDVPTSYEQLLEEVSEVNNFVYPDPRKSREGLAFLQGYVAESIDIRKYQDEKKRNLEEFEKLARPLMQDLKNKMPYFSGNYDEYEIEFEDQNIIFFMSMDAIGTAEKIKSYEYPDTSAIFALNTMGTFTSVACVQNSSENKAGAMVVINEMISPVLQTEKLQFGDQTIYTRLNDEEVLGVLKQSKRNRFTLKFSEFMEATSPEFDSMLQSLLLKIWEEEVAKD